MFSKQVSFIVDHKGNRKAAVVPIEIFDELMAMQKALASRQPGEREQEGEAEQPASREVRSHAAHSTTARAILEGRDSPPGGAPFRP